MTKLPNNEIGPSDIIAYRECPQRFAFDMRRHMPMPDRFRLDDDEKADPPERENYAGSYGSAIHDAIEIVEKTQCGDEEAIDAVWPRYQHWLEPEDADRMRTDLGVYRTRVTTGYRLLGTEIEMRTPLFVHEGQTIYLRGRVDVLYQHLQNAGVFLSRDYKSSRWPKAEEEVHKDLQQWIYNFLIHENYPECVTLVQQYDQLRFGSIPTRKSDTQRAQIKAWLIRQVRAILEDESFKPKANNWCYTCPLMADCRVTHLSTDYWKNRLALLAPEEKEARKLVIQLDERDADEYVAVLPKAKDAAKTLERYIERIERLLKDMPASRRAELGYALAKARELDTFDASAILKVQEITGPDFPHLVSITKKAIESMYGLESEPAQQILALATKKQTAPSLRPLKK